MHYHQQQQRLFLIHHHHHHHHLISTVRCSIPHSTQGSIPYPISSINSTTVLHTFVDGYYLSPRPDTTPSESHPLIAPRCYICLRHVFFYHDKKCLIWSPPNSIHLPIWCLKVSMPARPHLSQVSLNPPFLIICWFLLSLFQIICSHHDVLHVSPCQVRVRLIKIIIRS